MLGTREAHALVAKTLSLAALAVGSGSGGGDPS